MPKGLPETTEDELRPEYDLSQLGRGVRGKYYRQAKAGTVMDTSVVTARGQIAIPSKLRRKLGIKKGTQVYLYERDGEIVVRALTGEYLRGLAGILGTKGKLLKALKCEKARARDLWEPLP